MVSLFALVADLLKPKSFAGIFGAAPSVALATLALTIANKGSQYAADELRATICGAVAFFRLCLDCKLADNELQAKRLHGHNDTSSLMARHCVQRMGHFFEVMAMRIQISLSLIFKTKWYEYAIRFLLGGLITVSAGLVAEKWGPSVGGLFLAFLAIFPASATLVEKHEKQAKQAKGLAGTLRAKNAAAVDAAGASIGSIGLLVFALVGSVFLPHDSVLLVLLFGTVAWFLVSTFFCRLRKAI